MHRGSFRAGLAALFVAELGLSVLASFAGAAPSEAAGQTLTFTPAADAYVSAAAPSTNYGTRTALRVDGSPILRSYLRFDLQGISDPVVAATLRIFANSNHRQGYSAYAVADTMWGETSITYANAPAMSATSTGSSGRVTTGTWTEVDVTPLVSGNGAISVGIATTGSTALALASRESGANAPQLVVVTASDASPTATSTSPPPSPPATATATKTATPPPPTDTPTATPTATSTPTAVPTATNTPTPPPATDTPAATPTATLTPTAVPTATDTPEPPPATDTPTATPSATPTPTPDSSSSPTVTDTVPPSPTATLTSTPTPAAGIDATLIAAGDIASCNSSGDEATAALLDSLEGTVITLGDNAYESGLAAEYADCYDPTWGRVKARTRPVPGNHEYVTGNAAGYYDYFGAAAGDPTKGYYSYDLGSWHIIALNTQCGFIGHCYAGSPQEQWLRADLQAHPASCTLAYWHQPRFTSGVHGSNPKYDAFWQALYEAGVDVVLNGHDHDYERFAPQNPSGLLDIERGIREFVVGSGGKSHSSLFTPIANSEVREGDTYGVLKLTLHATSYDWEFVPVAGSTFGDGGSGSCH